MTSGRPRRLLIGAGESDCRRLRGTLRSIGTGRSSPLAEPSAPTERSAPPRLLRAPSPRSPSSSLRRQRARAARPRHRRAGARGTRRPPARLRGRFRYAAPELLELLALAGLDAIVPCAESGVESRRQPEHREEPLGVQEERDPADPVAVESRPPGATTARGRRPAPACTDRTPPSRWPSSRSAASRGSRSPARGTSAGCRRGSGATARTAASTTSRPRAAARSARPCRTARTPRRSAPAAPRCSARAAPRGPPSTFRIASVARARWSALLTDATVVPEQLGDLVGVPAQDLAQDQHRALAGRQVLERGDERQPDRLAGDGHLGRVTADGHGPIVRHRLDPGRLGQRGPERRVGRGRRAHVHGPRAALAGAAACRGRRWWRSGTATSGARRGPRTDRGSATPG